MPHQAMPIRDTNTGEEYPSKASAGRALAIEFGLDPADQHVWYAILKASERDRFLTANPTGEWVALDHPSLPSPPPAWGA